MKTSTHRAKKWLILLTVLACSLMPLGSAFADCRIQSSNGSDDIVVCTNPADTNGIATGSGNDTVTVNADTEVRGGNRAIDTGVGNDTVTNRGKAYATDSSVFMDQGNDTLNNYGTLTSGDHAARCFPQSGQTCRINNYATINVTGEALDTVSSNGRVIVYNGGTITSAEQEAVHGHGYGTVEVTNAGTMNTRRQSVEVYYGTGIIVNTGTMIARDFSTIDTDRGNDQITNRGSLRSDTMAVIETAGGNDTIRHTGSATARNSSTGGGVIDAGSGNDSITVSGNLTETGNGYAAIKAGAGSDTVAIEGGAFNRVIDGGSESDTLIFRFSGSQSEMDAFRASMSGKSPSGGSVTFRGKTYRWKSFERISLELSGSGSGSPAPTPAPTSAPPGGSTLGAGTYDDTHSAITYTGSWGTFTDAKASGGTFRYTSDANGRASFSFSGTKVTLYRVKAYNRGPMQVCIDGSCHTVQNYDAGVLYQQGVSFTAAAGTHRVEIRNTSTAVIDLDAVRIE